MIKNRLAFGLLWIFIGCATTGGRSDLFDQVFGTAPVSSRKQKDPDYITTVISPNFNFQQKKKLAILPFSNSGKEGLDYAIPDKLSVKLMEMGFTVVDRSQIEAVFQELKLNYSGAIAPETLKQIGKLLSVDMIVVGTAHYVYVPPRSSGGVYGGSYGVPGIGDYEAQGGFYGLVGESLRMIDVETGEVLISSNCQPENGHPRGKSMAYEIAESINRKLQPSSDH